MSRIRRFSAALAICLAGAALWLFPSPALACGAFVPLQEHLAEPASEPASGESHPLLEIIPLPPIGDLFGGGDDDEHSGEVGYLDLFQLVGHDREQMVYVVDDGSLTVYQGRSFAGDVREFAWLLPVPGEPEIELAPREIFAVLDEMTAPSFALDDESDGDCPAEVQTLVDTVGLDPMERGLDLDTDLDTSTTLGLGSPGLDDIEVVVAGGVGPFEYITITTREDLKRPGERALAWLEEEGYSLQAVDDELLDTYLGQGLNLLAFRLRADARVDEIRPVAISVDADQAMSPIRLGAMGAADQTGIQVWVAASHRVVPENYSRIQPNQALIDWSDGGTNYDEVVAEAVREAGGQAFAIDATMDTSELGQFLLSTEKAQRWEAIRNQPATSASDRRSRLMELARFLEDFDDDQDGDISADLRSVKQDFLPISHRGVHATKTERFAAEAGDDDLLEFDWERWFEAVEDEIITPRRRAQQRLTSVGQLTRLSTTMSPDDMTRDAYFVEDPEAEPRPRQRRGTRRILCGADSEQQKEVRRGGEKRTYITRDWRFDPPHGTSLEGHGDGWPVAIGDEEAAYEIIAPRSDRGAEITSYDSGGRLWDGKFRGIAILVLVLVLGFGLPVVVVMVIKRRS